MLMMNCSVVYPQAENVPVSNPIYLFMKRMELEGVLPEYPDGILPLSRREISEYLAGINERKDQLSDVERRLLEEYNVEFHHDISGFISGMNLPRDTSDHPVGPMPRRIQTRPQSYLYHYGDTNVSLFIEGLFTLDARGSVHRGADRRYVGFLQFGGRIRGSIGRGLGYYLQGTNAQFWGDRVILQQDKLLGQSFELNDVGVRNFDFVEGYVRYDAGIVSIQVGRERLLWGNGYGDKLILSDNPRVFDFIRLDAHYKTIKYTFLHAWLLGGKSNLLFTLSSDTLSTFTEPVVADKYFAGHRLEVTIPSYLTVGFQEVVIYSNRAPDLAYLNPVTLIESAQRSREERDNVLWAFDVQTHFLTNIELQGTVLFDDINFTRWGTNDIQNKYAFQLGTMVVGPGILRNTSMAVEYTRIEPYTFSHARSRNDNYGSSGRILGHRLGPNADSWFVRLDHIFSHKVRSTISYEVGRRGDNVYDSSGALIINSGGDFLQPHRPGDPAEKRFLAGDVVYIHNMELFITYEIVNEVFFDIRYNSQKCVRPMSNESWSTRSYGAAIRVVF